MYQYQGKIDRIIDGDTIVITVDLGFHCYHKQHFRLINIDAPEVRGVERPQGLESKQFLIDTIDKYGSNVLIDSFGTDKYGRYVADVFFHDDDNQIVSISDYMLENNQAIKYKK